MGGRVLPFCDGRVATYGFSYQGLNQVTAAARRPPSLRAIAPMMCSPEPYRDWTYQGGCLRWPFVTSWAAQLGAQEQGTVPIEPNLEALPIADALGPDPPVWFRDWLAHPADDCYWQARRADLEAVDVPVFTVLGFFDDFATGTARLFETLGAVGVCGPWAHMPWGTRHADIEMGESARPAVAHDALLAFFDRVLKGVPGPPAEVVYFDRVHGWRSANSWPPEHRIETWSATSGGNANSRHGDGRLGPRANESLLGDVFVSEPLAPYPGALAPLSDESAAEDRRDVLCYTTDTFTEQLSLAGMVEVEAQVGADVDTHDLIVSAAVVGITGTSRRLVTGARRLTTNADAVVTIGLGPLAWTIAVGERLRLDISAARFPAFDRNPQSWTQPVAFTPRAGYQVATIHLQQLRIKLPVIDGGVAANVSREGARSIDSPHG